MWGEGEDGKLNQEEFTAVLTSNVDARFGEIMASKPEGKKHMTYIDATTMSATIRNIFTNKIGKVPVQVEAACRLSEAVLAPSLTEKKRLIKSVFGIAGGGTGIAMVIGGIGAALGWGAGVIAAVVAFFVGTPLAGPIGWIAGGAALTAIAGYFALAGDEASHTERYLNCLKNGLEQAMPPVWEEHSARLSK